MTDTIPLIGKNYPIASTNKTISNVDDFPTPVSGVITLEDNTSYLIDGDVNIGENRIVCGVNNAIYGISPEISYLHNTLDGQPMITSVRTINCYFVTFYVSGSGASILNLDASASPVSNNAIDWAYVNFSGGDIGTITSYSNCIFNVLGMIDKTDIGLPALGNGFIFGGTIDSVVFTDSLFVAGAVGRVALTFPSGFTMNRRFRASECAFVIFNNGAGIAVDAAAVFNSESIILTNTNFSGGATYLSGFDYTDDEARIQGCRGVTNSYAAAYQTMTGNATATVISVIGTPVKVAGTTVGAPVSQKFDVTTTSNRSTYVVELRRLFKVAVTVTLSSGNNNQIGVYIAKNGTVIDESETYITTDSGGRLQNGYCQVIATCNENDYFEVWVENNTATTNITVEDMNVIITEAT